MDPAVVNQASFRTESLSTIHTNKWSLSRMFPHMDSQIKLFNKALSAFLTKARFVMLNSYMSVNLVRSQLTFGHKASSTHVARKWPLPCMDSEVIVILRLASKWFFEHMPQGNGLNSMWVFKWCFPAEGSPKLFPHSWRTYIFLSLSSKWAVLMCLFRLLGCVNFLSQWLQLNLGIFICRIMDFNVVFQHTPRNVILPTNITSKFQFFGMRFHVVC